MGKISSYGANVTPDQEFELIGTDPENPGSGSGQGAGGKTGTVTWAQVGAAASADVARVFIAGHSYPSGFNNDEDGEAWPDRLTAALHAEQVRYANTGAVLAQDLAGGNSGGYPTVVNGLTPRVFANGSSSVRNSSPYLPLSPVFVLDYGGNDLQNLNSDVTTAIAWYSMALTACCCIGRAGGWFPDTDASVAFSSGWTANTGHQVFGWPTDHSAAATGETVTLTVPADFPGGEVDLLSLAWEGGTKWSTTVDSGGAQVLDGTGAAFGSLSGRVNLVVQRLTGLSAGSHTIVMTVEAIDSGALAVFEGWLIAAPQAPTGVLVNQPLFPALPVTGGLHSPVTAADETALNVTTAAVAGGFADGNVVLADIASAFAAAGGNVTHTSAGSLYSNDDMHPNAAGHGLIAAVVRDAIRSAPLPGLIARSAGTGLVKRFLNGPLEPQLSAGWSIFSQGSAVGWFARDPAGNVQMRMTLQKDAAGSFFETIFTLPAGYAPSLEAELGGLSFSGETPSFAAVIVTADGAVQWLGGDPTTELDFFVSYAADGIGF